MGIEKLKKMGFNNKENNLNAYEQRKFYIIKNQIGGKCLRNRNVNQIVYVLIKNTDKECNDALNN